MIVFCALLGLAFANCDLILEWQGVLSNPHDPHMHMHKIQKDALNKKLGALSKYCDLWVFTNLDIPPADKYELALDPKYVPRERIISTVASLYFRF